jgi:sarcosine oxidase
MEFEVAVVGLGGIGSAAAYWASLRVGAGVLGLERFELGHERGASQDNSRIIRLSYHAPEYVRFARDAYAAWAEVEEDSGERLVIRTGGLDLYPEGTHAWSEDYTRALEKVGGIDYEWLDAAQTMKRWPAWRLSDDVRVMFQPDAGIAAAARANDAHRRLAQSRGATLVEHARATDVCENGGMYEIETEAGTFRAERLILATDAWTNELLSRLWRPINLTVTQEQVCCYAPSDPGAFEPERFPIWIWMGVPSFYGVATFGEDGPKIGEDVGGAEVSGDARSFEPDASYQARLDAFMRERLPSGFGSYLRRKTCLYTMTPDRDFVIDLVPGHEHVAIGQGAAHGFKFASVFGRCLVELVFDGKARSDIGPWTIERDVLTADDPPPSFRV